MPAKSELTEKIVDDLCDQIRTVVHYKTAIHALGFSEDVFYKWRRRGDAEIARRANLESELGKKTKKGKGKVAFTDPVSRGEELFVRFVESVRAARAKGTTRNVLIVQKTAAGSPNIWERDKEGNIFLDGHGNPVLLEPARRPNWLAARWILETSDRSLWGRRALVAVEIEREDDDVAETFAITIVDERTTPPESFNDIEG